MNTVERQLLVLMSKALRRLLVRPWIRETFVDASQQADQLLTHEEAVTASLATKPPSDTVTPRLQQDDAAGFDMGQPPNDLATRLNVIQCQMHHATQTESASRMSAMVRLSLQDWIRDLRSIELELRGVVK